MRLKSLKLAGFKSFANPTTFTFTKNITAIVGPNGCGKSNVIDAIRWVLGESSAKQLRGGSMSDVIFAGANGKSARSMASVELTFEHAKDSDTGIRHALNLYQELSLRRQIASDGKSDYFINGQKVRRRDVVDVFLGTGLSARSYAVIEQGMIGRIIDADGVRLREFIEESAGVSRYQARRGETQKQLGIAKDNLERLADLQSELAKQQKSLSEQARVADEYETLKAKLTDIETELLTHRLFDAWQTHQAHTQTADTLATQKQIFDAQMSTLQREVQTHTKQLYEIDHLKEATATAHHKKALKTQSAKHLWDKAVEDKQNATHTLDRLIDEHKLADDTDHTHTKAICTHAQAIAQIESKLSVIEEDICHYKHAKNTLDTDHHTLNKCLTELEAEHQSLTNRLAIASAGHARTQGDLEKWHVKHDKAKALLDNHSQQKGVNPTYLADLQDKIATIGEQIATLQDDIKADKPLLVNYEKHTITAQECLAKLEKTHARLASEYDTLHTLVYPSKSDKESTKPNAALTDAVALPTLGDTLTLTTLGQEYTQVLDDVLKPLLDDGIISQMGLSALECKHTVWQLAQKAVSVPQQSAPQKDAILLSQLIKEPMLSLWQQVYLLTKMPACLGEYLDEQLDTHSKAIAKLSVYDVLVSQYTKVAAFILPTGAIVHRYGILLPSTDRSDGLLTRRKAHLERLAVLEDELSSTETRIDAHTDTLSDAKRQYAEKKQENSDRTALLAIKMHELSVLQAEHTKLAQEQQRKADMLTHIHHTLDGLSEEKTELDADIAQSAQLIQQTTAKLQQISPLLEEAKAKLSAHQDRQHDVKKTLSALYDDRQRLSLSLTHHQQSVTYITDAQNTAKTARINRKNTIQSQQKKLDELTTKLPTLELAYLTLKNECTILSDELSAYTQKSEQVKQSANQSQALLDECQQNLAKQNDKFAKLSADIAVALARMQDLGESLKQRDEAFDLLKQIQVFDSVGFVPSLPIKTLIEKQKKLIQCQSKLGAVNLSAKDELNELNSRLDPMTKEMADIQTSIETLQGAIDAIDQKTKGLFMATLRAVNDELNNLFSKVFGGGQASLSLSEDENLPQADKWRAGLVLMAQPKGKKNSRLAVLSGGEKTLTALSLIFAIFKQHPAPFCVLDEVDAPLDDANVERFTNLIDELACNVQFIFISHNKLAMQIADELKGVTMPVAGISSLVSVSLDEVEAMVAN